MCGKNKLEIVDLTSDIEEFDAVMYLAIDRDSPVIIIKNFREELNPHKTYESKNLNGAKELWIFSSYVVYWKGKFYKQRIPSVVKKQYGSQFVELLFRENRYSVHDFPDGVIELPLDFLQENRKFKIVGFKYTTPLKTELRKYGYLKEKRGANNDPMLQLRDNFIRYKFKGFNYKQRLPIKELKMLWEDFINKEFENDYDKAKKYYCEDSTIRRILQKK